MGWTNQSINELVIGQFPTEIVLSTQLPADLAAFYGSDLKSGILFYWNPTDYFYMVDLFAPGIPTDLTDVVFGFNNPSQGGGFFELVKFNPAGVTFEDGINISGGTFIQFTPATIGFIPAHVLYVDATGALRYQGGVTNTPIAPN